MRRWPPLLFVPLLIASAVLGAACAPADRPAESAAAAAVAGPAQVASAPPPPAPATHASARSMGVAERPAPPAPAWVVGSSPLPLRPDGLGQIVPTPAVLAERALPTSSGLGAPATDAFEWTVAPIDDATRDRMGATWNPGCPVALHDLRYLTVSFWGFDGGHHTGELVVNASVVDDVVSVFERLHAARFPLEEMRLVTTADLDAAPTGDGNNTASFVCRSVRGGSSWSEHAHGLAIDINPFQNPYARGEVVLPELASAYLDRTWTRPGMIRPGDVVTEAFAAIGWRWGGDWSSPDYMHFSRTGR